MGAARGVGEIPLLSSFLYLFDEAEAGPCSSRCRGSGFWRWKVAVCPRGAARPIRVEDSVRWGVWLGRHICQRLTQVS